jgi:putative ABC transport system permease protein
LNAIVAQLDAQVDKMMAMMQDKDALITQISTGMSGQVGMSEADIAAYLAEMTLEELKEMMRPAMEEQISAGIAGQVKAGMAQIPDEQKIALFEAELPKFTLEQNALYYDELTEFSDSTYDANLVRIGSLDLDKPQTINLYASTFENKDIIVETIANYNDTVDEAQRIAYTDYLGIMMSSITTIINAITYVLIAFVAISLVVSSIMIGVITLISVQERTKEIGILRAIGASKKNVSRMFNAETMIIGFASGMLGVVVTYLLCIPINMILYALTDIANLRAFLPIEAAVILVVISVMLTLISGIIPSRSAAKKDPVVALRTE